MNGTDDTAEHVEFTPRPDPTSLTTDQLRREIRALRELTETRLDGMDKADVALAETLTRRADALDAMSGQRHDALQDLMEEKFRGVDTHMADRDRTIDQQFEDAYTGTTLRFTERDTRSERESRDNKIAVDAAFAAAKEAVAENNKSSALATDKSEAGFTKQIDQLTLLIETRAKASDDKIDDIKDQLARNRGVGQGQQSAQGEYQNRRQNNQWVIATVISVIAVILTLGYLAISLAQHVGSGSTTNTPGITVIAPTAVPSAAPTASP